MEEKTSMTPKKKQTIIIVLWSLFAIPVVTVLVAILWIWLGASIPSFEELESPESNLATQVIADDGKTVLSTFHIENRSYVTYDELNDNLVHALNSSFSKKKLQSKAQTR